MRLPLLALALACWPLAASAPAPTATWQARDVPAAAHLSPPPAFSWSSPMALTYPYVVSQKVDDMALSPDGRWLYVTGKVFSLCFADFWAECEGDLGNADSTSTDFGWSGASLSNVAFLLKVRVGLVWAPAGGRPHQRLQAHTVRLRRTWRCSTPQHARCASTARTAPGTHAAG
jgi:hypothetical protein